VFCKPGAKVQIYVQTAPTPQDQLKEQIDVVTEGGNDERLLSHTVSWEYWNGRTWDPVINPYSNRPDVKDDASPKDFSGTGVIELTIPRDMAKTKVNEQEGLWMRVRLLSGGYGIKRTIRMRGEVATDFTYIINQPPALAKFLLGYTWQHGPFPAEHVLTYNDFQYEDRTE